MTENPLTIALLINSILPIGLILNQNDNTKESNGGVGPGARGVGRGQGAQNNKNPLEIITWFALTFQLILLLIRTKITDY